MKKDIVEMEKELEEVEEIDLPDETTVEPNPREVWKDYKSSLKKEITLLKKYLKSKTEGEKTDPRGKQKQDQNHVPDANPPPVERPKRGRL